MLLKLSDYLKKTSYRDAAKIYQVPKSTLYDRIAGRTPRLETRPNCRKLNDIEEDTIVQYILNLDSRGFPPRLASVEDMANLILKSRGQDPVGQL